MKIKDELTEENFDELFKGRTIRKNQIRAITGTPIFTKKDITEYPDILAKQLRSILADNKVTKEEFNIKFRIYATEILRLHPTKIATQQRNIYKAMLCERITWRTFMVILVYILGYNFVDFQIDLITDMDEKKTYRLSETFNKGK